MGHTTRGKPDAFWKYHYKPHAMSTDPARVRCCGKKIRHGSLSSAQEHARSVPKRPGRKLTAYKCRFCRYWHVGNVKTP